MTVYSHFGDKQTLFREVIKRQATTLADALAFPSEGDSGELREDRLKQELTAFGIGFVRFLSRPDIKAWNRLRHEEAKNYPDLAKTFSQGARVVLDTLTSRLDLAHERGELKVCDSATAARQLIGMLASADALSAIGLHEEQTLAKIRKHVNGCVDAFLRAYAAGAENRPGLHASAVNR